MSRIFARSEKLERGGYSALIVDGKEDMPGFGHRIAAVVSVSASGWQDAVSPDDVEGGAIALSEQAHG